jgi:hypothetical protein
MADAAIPRIPFPIGNESPVQAPECAGSSRSGMLACIGAILIE